MIIFTHPYKLRCGFSGVCCADSEHGPVIPVALVILARSLIHPPAIPDMHLSKRVRR
jgi:hypothetical protein